MVEGRTPAAGARPDLRADPRRRRGRRRPGRQHPGRRARGADHALGRRRRDHRRAPRRAGPERLTAPHGIRTVNGPRTAEGEPHERARSSSATSSTTKRSSRSTAPASTSGTPGRARCGRRPPRRARDGRRPRRRERPQGLRRGPVAADGARRAGGADPPARRPHGGARRRPGHPRRHEHGQAVPAGQARRRPFGVRTSGSSPTTSATAVGEAYPMDSGHHTYSEFGPAGVVAAISPWNFPLMMATWKIAPAIAWGNTCIIKPSEDTPASVTLLGRLAVEAGFPPGRAQRAQRARGAGGLVAHRRRPGRPGDLHRLLGHRQARHGLGRDAPRPGLARARRQGRQHRLRGRRPRQRRVLGGRGDLPQLRADLPGRVAAVRALLASTTSSWTASSRPPRR